MERLPAGGDSEMTEITHAFVSYSHQDAIIAEVLERQLMHLAERGKGQSFLTCFLDAKSIPTGQQFEPIIRTGLEGADWLIVIFTGDQSVYCGFEIGLYSSINPAPEKPIVCLHDVDRSRLPGVVNSYNTVMIAAIAPYLTNDPIASGQEMNLWWDSAIGRFLREFCRKKSLYTPEDRDNPSEYTVDIATAAKTISNAFELARQGDEKSETPVQAGFEITINPSSGDQLTRIPEESILIGTSRAFVILGLNLALSPNSAPQISWGELRKALLPKDRVNVPWMDKLETNVALAAALKVPEPEDVTFKGRDDKIYRAILTRHKLYMNGKRIFFVLLVETFDRRFIGDRRSSLLLISLTLASRWRFTFFEKWHDTVMKFDDSLSDQEFKDSCKQLEYNMEWMENEGVELGADDQKAMVEAFGFENKARVERFYSDFAVAKATLKTELPVTFEGLTPEIRARAKNGIVTFLTSIKEQNVEFLKLCVDKYKDQIHSALD
jgi:hypothetical protein